MRLGILHDPAAQERMYERERKKEEDKKRKAEMPTVRTAEEQKKFEEEAAAREKAAPKKEDKPAAPRIRPLSEAKAIELGANFFSEAFIFAVAAGLLVWDSWRSRKKESARRDLVAERLEQLEMEVYELRQKHDPELKSLSEKVDRIEDKGTWWDPRSWWTRTDPRDVKDADDELERLSKVSPVRSALLSSERASQDGAGAKEGEKIVKASEPVANASDKAAKAKESPVRVKAVEAGNEQR